MSEQNHPTLPLPGSRHYKAFVGPVESYDLISAIQFNLLTSLGLRQEHYLLDIGCGSLRGGKLFIPYLLPGRYFGIEPEQWLIEEGIKNELGNDIISIKKPTFNNSRNFALSIFDKQFDFILAQSIFSHASSPQIEQCLSEARKVMKKSSIFAATFVEGAQNYTGKAWLYPNCTTYTLDYVTNLVEKSGLSCKPINWPHPTLQRWILICDPTNDYNAPSLNDSARLLQMEAELKFCKERILKIKSHPYVKFGLKVNCLISQMRQFLARKSNRDNA
ncbi:MAG: class I SAM-dependent methyltransferase [Candidatus Omnitrophica bacterium]|nr:class I SAM-dependent methyltransferase [Candidatus Omnitrophota bacterium]